ncbi:hypothetical protein KW541_17145 [Vibrio fluvialis]|nr:hypothetical protein [Vibrio fluvialis]
MENRMYWTVDVLTKEVSHHSIEAKFRGGIYHVPKEALTIEPLPPKEGFAVIVIDNLSGTEYIEDHRGTVIYDTTDCTLSETVNELGPIKKGFTDKKPKTRWDKWTDGDWVTDLNEKYIADFDHVDNVRRSRYFTMVDPLVSEANIKRLQSKDAEAIELEQQAVAAREKIQLENPWPIAPEA